MNTSVFKFPFNPIGIFLETSLIGVKETALLAAVPLDISFLQLA